MFLVSRPRKEIKKKVPRGRSELRENGLLNKSSSSSLVKKKKKKNSDLGDDVVVVGHVCTASRTAVDLGAI